MWVKRIKEVLRKDDNYQEKRSQGTPGDFEEI